ncbi:hypothetical protein C3L33_01794, partial [Rhododendron williamsianum]
MIVKAMVLLFHHRKFLSFCYVEMSALDLMPTLHQLPSKGRLVLLPPKDPIPTSVLKINNDLVKLAVKLFKLILKYMGVDSPDEVSLDERIELVGQLYKQGLKNSELRDELFAQILKQTRNNPDKQYSIRAWELMYLCASCMSPSTDIGGFLTEYVRNEAEGANSDPDIQVLALSTLNTLKISCNAGPRQKIPGRDEIKALLIGKQLNTTVFFLDETFEEITYGIATTVADAIEYCLTAYPLQELAGIIKLQAYSSFSLFECRKVVAGSKSPEPGNADFKAPKDPSKGDLMLRKLVFRKKFFRESDEAIGAPVFVYLSYVQLQNDYILGNYPVGREDAAQLAALQILLKMVMFDWASQLDHFLPKHIAVNRPIREWVSDILFRYRSMENLTKNEARQQFLRILRALPYGHSIFFTVRKSEDPLGLLPGKFTLAINNRGVHFFRLVPVEYLHSAELREIMQFGSSSTAVFFKMRVANVLQVFQFETKQGEEICASLKTHINDVMLRSNSTAKSAASVSTNGDISDKFTPSNGEAYEKRIEDLSRALEESKRAANQAALSEKRNMEEKLTTRSTRVFESNASKELVEVNKKVALSEKQSMEARSELLASEETRRRLVNEKKLLEERIAGLEKQIAEEVEFLQENFEQESKATNLQVSELIIKLEEDIDRKNESTSALLMMQGAQLAELETLYKEEQVLRKQYFNTIEVHVEHQWKDDIKQHLYDRVFDGIASQEDVFDDARYLVQSAVDGYNGMVSIDNVTVVSISTLDELNSIIRRGSEQRHTSGTGTNEHSSRSHVILSIVVESTNLQTKSVGRGKLSFVDLAGSERTKSLALMVNHKLTMLMSDSLGGNAKTLMFVNISPAETNLDETNNSLTYASRVRAVVNDPKKNVSSKEVLRLKKLLAYWKEKAGRKGDDEDLEEIQEDRLTEE